MYPSVDNLPTPIGTLDELMGGGDTSAKPMKVFIAHNLGNRAFLMAIPMHDFYGMSDVANDRSNGEPVSQRPLDLQHAHSLATYILRGLVSAAIESRFINRKPELPQLKEVLDRFGGQPYLALQPIVCNLRSCSPRGANISGHRMITKDEETACYKVMLSQKDILWVVDGQHRRKAMEIVFDFLSNVRATHKYLKKGSLYPVSGSFEATVEELAVWNECVEVARGFCTVTVEVHLGLDVDQERQLFHDLNNLGKKITSSLALVFDNSNPINRYIKEELLDKVLGWEAVEKDIVNWQDDSGVLPFKDLAAINAHLFLNKTNIKGAVPGDIKAKEHIANRFWSAVRDIPGFGVDKAKLNTVAAQPVMLKALAKLVFDFAFSRRKGDKGDQYLEILLDGISEIDFSHTNPIWRYFELSEAEKNSYGLVGLQDYLPSTDEGYNRDVGGYDSVAKVMRFGTKHNDIYPILADMIRWILKFPSRRNDVDLNELI